MKEKNELTRNPGSVAGYFLDKWLFHFTENSEKQSETIDAVAPFYSKGPRLIIPVTILRILPLLFFFGLVSTFLISTDRDFHNWSGDPISLLQLIRTISVAGLIGYFTNWLAVKMLFHPVHPRPVLGQGLIGANREKIIQSLVDGIREEIINEDMLIDKFKNSAMAKEQIIRLSGRLQELTRNLEFRDDLVDVIRFYANRILGDPIIIDMIVDRLMRIDTSKISGAEGKALSLYRLLRGEKGVEKKLREFISGIPMHFSSQDEALHRIMDGLPEKLEQWLPELEEHLIRAAVYWIKHADIHSLIKDNLENFDDRRLEKLLLRSSSDQLKFIQYLGGLLGFLGGFFIIIPLESFIILGCVTIMLLSLDWILLKNRNSKN